MLVASVKPNKPGFLVFKITLLDGREDLESSFAKNYFAFLFESVMPKVELVGKVKKRGINYAVVGGAKESHKNAIRLPNTMTPNTKLVARYIGSPI